VCSRHATFGSRLSRYDLRDGNWVRAVRPEDDRDSPVEVQIATAQLSNPKN
jgi:hypothetical protein